MINLWLKRFSEDIHPFLGKYLESRGWKYLGCGSFRNAYRRKNTVIKVPRNWEGFEDNVTEAYAYRKYRNSPDSDGLIFCPCRLLPNGCLMMPFVDNKGGYCNDLPDWAKSLDGWQAGYYKGRVVGYDTGYNIKHENKEAFEWAKVESQ